MDLSYAFFAIAVLFYFGCEEKETDHEEAYKALIKVRSLKDTVGFCFTSEIRDKIISYKIRWCGRFAIPFGLECIRQLADKLGHPLLTGYLLRYDTSCRLGRLFCRR